MTPTGGNSSPGLAEPKGIQSVERAGEILRLLAATNGNLTISALASELGVHKSTASRLLSALRTSGLVDQDELTGQYQLGLEIVRMAGNVLGQNVILRTADPLLRHLNWSTEGTVNLVVPYNNQVVCIEQVPAPKRAKGLSWLGQTGPLHQGAAAKALLGHLSDRQIETYIRDVLSDAEREYLDRLWQEIAEIRARGYATNRAELRNNVFAIGAPVFDSTRQPCASVSVLFDREDFQEDQFRGVIEVLAETVETISRQLGFDEQAIETVW